jgi:hypothetical protein
MRVSASAETPAPGALRRAAARSALASSSGQHGRAAVLAGELLKCFHSPFPRPRRRCSTCQDIHSRKAKAALRREETFGKPSTLGAGAAVTPQPRMTRALAALAALFSKVGQIVVPHRQALRLESIQHERSHRHVGVGRQAGELLAEALAQA